LTPPITVSHNGRELTIAELSRAIGVSKQQLHKRYAQGLRGDQLKAPMRPTHKPTAAIPRGIYL
jgi:hypothetical protein